MVEFEEVERVRVAVRELELEVRRGLTFSLTVTVAASWKQWNLPALLRPLHRATPLQASHIE
jgi:hypothetical protein